MAKKYSINGATYEFPDNYSPEQVQEILTKQGVIKGGRSEPSTSSPPSAPSPDSPFSELLAQGKKFASGLGETFKSAAQAMIPGEKGVAAILSQGQQAKESLKAPGRELMGKPQPEEKSGSRPWAIRPLRAAQAFLGADPAEVRKLYAEGKPQQAAIAGWTIPAINLAMGRFLGRAMGKKLPTTETRIGNLTAASRAKFGEELLPAYEIVLPELDKTLGQQIKAGQISPERLSKFAAKDLVKTVDDTMARLETDYQLALQPIRGQMVVPTKIADAIRGLKREGGQPHAGRAGFTEDRVFNNQLEMMALEYDQPTTWGVLDKKRQELFRKESAPQAERVIQRTNAEIAAEKAARETMRDMLYERVSGIIGVPGWGENLKRVQANLYTIKDKIKPLPTGVAQEAAIQKATPWYEKEKVAANLGTAGGMHSHTYRPIFKANPEKRTGKQIRKALVPQNRIGKLGEFGISGALAAEEKQDQE